MRHGILTRGRALKSGSRVACISMFPGGKENIFLEYFPSEPSPPATSSLAIILIATRATVIVLYFHARSAHKADKKEDKDDDGE